MHEFVCFNVMLLRILRVQELQDARQMTACLSALWHKRDKHQHVDRSDQQLKWVKDQGKNWCRIQVVLMLSERGLRGWGDGWSGAAGCRFSGQETSRVWGFSIKL